MTIAAPPFYYTMAWLFFPEKTGIIKAGLRKAVSYEGCWGNDGYITYLQRKVRAIIFRGYLEFFYRLFGGGGTPADNS
jgi:hypothetical protein